jgi:hypothetical protein
LLPTTSLCAIRLRAHWSAHGPVGLTLRRLAFAAALSAFLVATAAGETTGAITGRVVGSTGDALAGVTIDATSASLQGKRSATTDASGWYRIQAVPPGVYRLHAALPGFRDVDKSVDVHLDATATADFTMNPQSSEHVLVSGTATSIDESSTTQGTTYSFDVIDKLPVARNYADIVRANPGVTTDYGLTQGRYLALSIYGATSAENQWIIDGVDTTNVQYGIQGKAINNDFVQEVEVMVGGYPAEYGRALGGMVNVITKAGGNEFHGNGFLYYDSTATAASKQFKPGDTGIAEMRTVAGATYDFGLDLGGYFLKDRLWFFAVYNQTISEAEISRVQASSLVPTSARFPANATNNFYSAKLTWNASSSTSIVGSVFADPTTTSGAAGADPLRGGLVQPPLSLQPTTWYSVRSQGGTDFGVRISQLFGTQAIAAIQGSSHHDQNALDAPDLIQYTDDRCLKGAPGQPCTIPDEPIAYYGGYGFVNGPTDHGVSSRSELDATVTFYRLNHEIKAGTGFTNGKTDSISYPTGGQLVYIQNQYGDNYDQYGPLYYAHQFYVVSPNDLTPVPSNLHRAQVLDYGAFLQDSWRPNSTVTVNVGLRWDGEQTRNYQGQTVLRLNDGWQPRIGVTWDPWGKGTTKVYAFAGLFDYALPTFAAATAFNAVTIARTFNFDPVSLVQDPAAPHDGFIVFSNAVGDSVDKGIQGTKQGEVALGIERLFTPALTVGLKGTYRQLTSALEDRCDFDYNSPLTGYNQCALINPGSNGQFAKGEVPTCNAFIGDPSYQCGFPSGPATPPAKRTYRGIELLARQAVSNTSWIQASYVYSSLKGNFDGSIAEAGGGFTAPGITWYFDFPALWHNSYGTLTLDRSNHFRLDGYWQTPFKLSVGLQAFAESGAPQNKLGYLNVFYNGSVFLVPQGSAGQLPVLWGTNLTLSYPIVVGPATVTLEGYLTNVFNKQIAISRDDVWSNSPPAGYPATIFDPNQQQTNPDYGKITGRSDPRVFRAAVKIGF